LQAGSPSSDTRRVPEARRAGGGAEATNDRRHLTVVFCDLVGSTALAERLDPEDLQRVVRDYHAAVASVVERLGGFVARYQGDGLLLYFGYPSAHEDDARRAVLAGLEVVGAVARLGSVDEGGALAVRIGIHSGVVVLGAVGDERHGERMAFGETPNVAARLQALAEPGSVLASAVVRRLAEGAFEWRSLGPQRLKGISAPIEVYEALGETEPKSRFETATVRGLTPFVGREHEVGLLLERWGEVRAGSGQVVLLEAEAGLGKSRLVRELRERIPAGERKVIEFQCSPLHRSTALHPLAERLASVLEFAPEDPPERKFEHLDEWLLDSRLPIKEAAPLLGSLLSLPTERYPPLNMSPQLQREKTREALVAWLLAEAERSALLVTFEDLHWADLATLELVGLLIDESPTARVLVILTFRPELRPGWSGRSYVTQMTLGRFARGQAEALVARVAGGKELPAEVVAQIVRRTDGVPLFLEELTRMLLESGHLEARDGGYDLKKPIAELEIPSTLQGSLMARLDRLGEAKAVAQVGAVIGREFGYELLRVVAPLEEAALGRALAALVEAELVHRRGLPPKARYVFKHALVQDAAYQSLLKRSRRELHRKIADILRERFPEVADGEPELVAHHYTEAAEIADAIRWWQRAGNRAIGRNAVQDGIAHARRGIDLAPRLPEPGEQAFAEARLMGILHVGIGLGAGWGSAEAASLLPRILELTKTLPDGPELALSLSMAGVIQSWHDRRRGRDTLERALEVAERAGGEILAAGVHRTLATNLIPLGELEASLEHSQKALAAYDPDLHHPRRGTVFDLRVSALAEAGQALSVLGHLDRAHATSEEAIAHAKAVSHPASLAFALAGSLLVASLRRERHVVTERATALIELCREQRLPFYEGFGQIYLGSTAIEEGRLEEGIRLIEEALAAASASSNATLTNFATVRLAAAYAMIGRLEEASRMLARAREWYERIGEKMAEIEGTAARLAYFRKNWRETEAHLRNGLEKHRRQKAKLPELLFATGLARLFRTQGRKEEARRLLKEVYDWFTEGFDTAPLREARALLDELSATP
jgi:class 3 adenylate cyclase/tetratricopeptide (TPR) repeat protein